MKTFNIISADIITKADVTPFVGLTVNVNGQTQQIARSCKQALLDLHKSARASNIPANLFNNGLESANPTLFNQFAVEVRKLTGKVGMAEIEFYEAGAEYVASEVSTAVKEGTAKIGDILYTEKKGSRIEGFMNFPLSAEEQIIQQMIDSNPTAILDRIFGIQQPVALPAFEPTPEPTPEDNNGVNQEAFNGLTPEDFKDNKTKEKATTK